MQLEPCDVLIDVNDRKDPFSVIRRWVSGPYDHAALYLGRFSDAPLLYESDGKGLHILSITVRYGKRVVLLRPKILESERITIIDAALEIASDPKSYFDYFCIVTSVIPRLLVEKFCLPLPLKYHRNNLMICSEAVAETFWRNELDIIPKDIVPLPADFLDSPILDYVGEGILGKDIVSC
jgi:hypothetical protein